MSKELGIKREGKAGAVRQAEYAERQRALGRKQRSFWLTDIEYSRVMQLIEKMRISEEEDKQKP